METQNPSNRIQDKIAQDIDRETWEAIFALVELELVEDGLLDITETRHLEDPKYVNNVNRRTRRVAVAIA